MRASPLHRVGRGDAIEAIAGELAADDATTEIVENVVAGSRLDDKNRVALASGSRHVGHTQCACRYTGADETASLGERIILAVASGRID